MVLNSESHNRTNSRTRIRQDSHPGGPDILLDEAGMFFVPGRFLASGRLHTSAHSPLFALCCVVQDKTRNTRSM
jgi:hypothetical protein